MPKPKDNKMKLETLDDFCKLPEGSFKKFIDKKEAHLRNIEEQRKSRIRSSQMAACQLVWGLGVVLVLFLGVIIISWFNKN